MKPLFKSYRLIGWYNSWVSFTWKIIGSHIFFLLAALTVAYGTFHVLKQVPDGANALATKSGVVQAGAVLLGLFSILMAALQVRVNATWNKVLSYHTFFGDLITPEVLKALFVAADECGFKEKLKKYEALDDAHVEKIMGDAEHDATVSCYLNEFEEFCTAVNAGVVDDEYAYKLEGARLIRVSTVFAKYIHRCREDGISSRNLYAELEHRARRWNERKQDEDLRHSNLVAKEDRKQAKLAAKAHRKIGRKDGVSSIF